MCGHNKPLVWLKGEVKTPPFSREARLDTGFLLRRLQQGEQLSMPESRPMPSIGPRCHELRITDGSVEWRLLHRTDSDAVIILDVFKKKTQKTPKGNIDMAKRRLRRYDDESE
ncbi:MAG: type II toxin-antitoxin system RelE/ParE family toxin [Elusimicrobiota bacterium]|jgi:phage-related protein